MTAPRFVRIASSLPQPELPAREPRPPHLRVLPEPATVRARRLSRLFTALAGVAVCFGLFGVVGIHVMLAQGQGEVERLSTEVQQLEQQQQRLRLEVAELGSPTRIVETARRRLGMVTPTTVVSLAPASLAEPPPTTIPPPGQTTTTVARAATSDTTHTAATDSTGTEATGASTATTRP